MLAMESQSITENPASLTDIKSIITPTDESVNNSYYILYQNFRISLLIVKIMKGSAHLKHVLNDIPRI